MSGFFYNLGRQLGRRAVPAIRKSKLLWDSVAGTEEEALRAEMSLGSDLATELRSTLQPLKNATMSNLTDDICRRLSGCLRDKRRSFQIELFHDPVPNAMALPGGFLFLSDSLTDFCQQCPDELAFVIGHEMAHVIRTHAWDRLVNEATLRVAAAVTSRLGPLGGWLRQEGLVLLRSAHSKTCELEADELGYRLAMAAGFAGNGAIAFLQRAGRAQSGVAGVGQYLASHPPASERIARIQRIPGPG